MDLSVEEQLLNFKEEQRAAAAAKSNCDESIRRLASVKQSNSSLKLHPIACLPLRMPGI